MGSIGYFEAASDAFGKLEGRVKTVEEALRDTGVEESKAAAQAGFNALTEELKEMRQILASQDNQLAALRMFRAAVQPILDQQGKEVTAMREEVVRTESSFATLQSSVQALKNDLVAAQGETRAQQEQIRAQQEEISSLKLELRGASSALATLVGANAAKEEESAARDKFIKKLGAEVDALAVRNVRTLPCTFGASSEMLPLLPMPKVRVVDSSRVFVMQKPEHFSPVIDIDPSKRYEITCDVRCPESDEGVQAFVYLAVKCLDARLGPIASVDIMRKGAACTVVAVDEGSNTLTLDRDVSAEWYNGTTPCHQRSLGVYADGSCNRVRPDIVLQNSGSWDSKRSGDGAYSRIDGQVLYLNVDMPPGLVPQVSKVWNHYGGGKYMYPADQGCYVESATLRDWQTLRGCVGKVTSSWGRDETRFWKGTRYMQVGITVSVANKGKTPPPIFVRRIHVKEVSK